MSPVLVTVEGPLRKFKFKREGHNYFHETERLEMTAVEEAAHKGTPHAGVVEPQFPAIWSNQLDLLARSFIWTSQTANHNTARCRGRQFSLGHLCPFVTETMLTTSITTTTTNFTLSSTTNIALFFSIRDFSVLRCRFASKGLQDLKVTTVASQESLLCCCPFSGCL